MPPVGFESTISAGERLQTYALDRAAGHWDRRLINNSRPDFKLLIARFKINFSWEITTFIMKEWFATRAGLQA